MRTGILKKRLKNTALITATVLALPLFIVGLMRGALQADAFVGVFGGRITGIVQCKCTGTHVIIVGNPRPGRFHFTGGSRLFEYYQIKKVGAWVLGTYGGPSPCLRLKCPCGKLACCCVPVPHQGDIELVGTSR